MDASRPIELRGSRVNLHALAWARLAPAARVELGATLLCAEDGATLVGGSFGLLDVSFPFKRLGPWLLAAWQPLLRADLTVAVQLDAQELPREALRRVLPTSLYASQTGTLGDFPWAVVHAPAAALAAAHARPGALDVRLRPCHWAHGPRWQPAASTVRPWLGALRATQATEGFHFVELPGLGALEWGVAWQVDGGWLLDPGPTLSMLYASAPSGEVLTQPAAQHLRRAARETAARLLELERSGRLSLVLEARGT